MIKLIKILKPETPYIFLTVSQQKKILSIYPWFFISFIKIVDVLTDDFLKFKTKNKEGL